MLLGLNKVCSRGHKSTLFLWEIFLKTFSPKLLGPIWCKLHRNDHWVTMSWALRFKCLLNEKNLQWCVYQTSIYHKKLSVLYLHFKYLNSLELSTFVNFCPKFISFFFHYKCYYYFNSTLQYCVYTHPTH